MSRRQALALLLTISACPSAVRSQPAGWPTGPIKLIVPFSPGGPTDVLARTLAAKMSESLGKSVVVENKLGAGGMLGAMAAAQAPADGYTLLFHEIAATFAIQPAINKTVHYNAQKDFTPIGLAASGPIFMFVNAELPVTTASEFVALARSKPGSLSFASAGGIGQLPTHIGPELLKVKQGITLNHIPYKGTGPALVDVAAGRVSMIMTTGLGSAQPFLDGGKVRAVAISGKQRSEALPEVRTFAEQGLPLPELDGGTMWGLLGPAGLPRNMVTKLNLAMTQAMESADVRDKLSTLTIAPRSSTPEQLAAIMKKEVETWTSVLKLMNIQVE
jgi:tripartite-type tricarboxylate transporter receptor subunit TctC